MPLPNLWLLSDERNDAVLEEALQRLPRGSGLIYRHYHLADGMRIERWFELMRVARARGHVMVLGDSALTAREWGADGRYGAPRSLYPASDLLTLATVHSLREIGLANRRPSRPARIPARRPSARCASGCSPPMRGCR